MHTFRDQSISRKVKLVIMVTSSVALLLACAALVTYDLVSARQTMASDLSTLTKVIGTNSAAALAFNDAESAKEVLSALAAKQHVDSARIYDLKGELLAEYARNGEVRELTLPERSSSGTQFLGGYLIASEPIVLDGEAIGAIYLISDLGALRHRIRQYASVVATVLLASLLAALFLSSKLQRVISGPISHLAKTVRAVSVDKDYTIRAVKHGRDEMGMLIDGFNEMLSQIQERDARLQTARDELERRVEERTKELQDEIAERKQAVELLRRSEEHFRSLIENASDVITIIDGKGTILYESPSLERVLGLKPQTLMGTNALALTHPDDRKAAVALLSAAIGEDGPAGPFELRYQHADGSWRTLEVVGQLVRDESGAVEVIINSRDITERKRSEVALRESEEKYRTILQSIQDGYFEVDLRGTFTFFNDSLCRIIGAPAERLMGLNNRDYTDAETARKLVAAYNEVFRTGEPLEGFQHRVITRNGVEKFLESSILLRRDSTGKICGFRGTVRDITERTHAEHALRESQERYKTLFESATDAIMILDTEDGRMGRILAANAAAAQHTGYTVQELMNLSVADLQTPEQAELTSSEIPRIVQGEHLTLDLLRRRKDGTTFPIEVNAGPLLLGGKRYILSFARDLTQRKRTEDKLLRLATAVEQAGDIIVITDTAGNIQYVNPAFEQATGYSSDEVIGQNPRILKSGQHSVEFYKNLWETITQGVRWSGYLTNKRKDGSLYEEEATISPVRDATGKIVNYVAVKRDITERRKMEREVTMLAHAVRSIHDTVSITDIDDTVLFVNEAFLQTYGYERDELIGKNIRQIVRPPSDPRNSAMPSPRGVMTQPWEGELINRRKDGTEFPVQLSASPILDEDGRTIALIGVAQDITERKLAERALRESESRYKTLFNAASDSIMILDTEGDNAGRIIAANLAAAEITGYTVEELLNINVADLRTSLQASRVREDIERVLNGDKVTIELLWCRKDGITFPVEVNQSVLTLGDKHYVLDFARDLTQRKQSEKEVTMLAQAIRSIQEAVVVADPDGNIIFVNAAAVGVYGYEPDELVGKHVAIFHSTGESREFANEIVSSAKAGEWEGEMLSRRKDGTEFPIYLSCTAIPDENGQSTGFIGVSQDITERKRAISELQNAKESAEAASRAKSEFLANMSHEIRTPMNGIIGMTELALDTELSTEQREYLKMVKLSADSLLGVINDVLDFSKIEAGRLDLDRAEFSLQDAVDEVMKALAVRADQKGLELAYYLRPGVPERVVGDVGRLRQILVNLVGNAIKFTERGEVIVRVEAEAQTSEEVVLHFGVRDTGIGIPPGKETLIFESFTQADGSTTRKYGGTGLGLTISSQLVQMMSGEIWAESPVNLPSSYGTPGSMFHFTGTFGLPLDSVSRAHPPEMVDLEGVPVLVVDDNATNRKILEVQLAAWHMKPALVDGARSALRAIKDAASAGAPFRLALLDFHMPEMDGLALAEQIKSAPEGRDLRIIMMSSSVQQNQACPRGCALDASLLKPVKAAELMSVIRVVLGADAHSQKQRRQAGRKSAYPSRVLVADDSIINQELIRRLLEKWGHTAVMAENGLKALSLFDNERFDLVLMDLQMPEMNGFEVTAAIRQREHGAGTRQPIIALTAHALKGDRERCIAAGMDDYVSKPVDAGKLFDALEAAAIRRAGERSNCEPVRKALDLDGLMRNFDGDSDLVLTLARVFAESSLSQVEQIGDAIERGDAEALASGAHLLKGSVANFGARAAVDAVVQLEGIAKSGDLSIAGSALAAVETEIDRLKRELEMFEQASLL